VGDLTLLKGCCPRLCGRPRGLDQKNTLPVIPELVLRCFPVMLKIIPNQIIFPFPEIVRDYRFLPLNLLNKITG